MSLALHKVFKFIAVKGLNIFVRDILAGYHAHLTAGGLFCMVLDFSCGFFHFSWDRLLVCGLAHHTRSIFVAPATLVHGPLRGIEWALRTFGSMPAVRFASTSSDKIFSSEQ